MAPRRPKAFRRHRRRRTDNITFRLSCIGSTLVLLAVASFLTGNTQNQLIEANEFGGRSLSDFDCVSNSPEQGFCANASCVQPVGFGFPQACCRGSDESNITDNTECRTAEGAFCNLDELCVAELIPGGIGAAECLAPYESEFPLGLIIYILVLLYLFLAIAIVADDYFTECLDQIGEGLGLSEDVNGATFAAAGSSAPELFVSLADNVIAQTPKSIGIGTIVGSAIFNILIIIGLSALLAKLPEDARPGTKKQLDWRPVARDSTFYALSIIALFVVVLDTKVEWYEGLALTLGYFVYIIFMAFNERFWDCVAPRAEEEEQPVFDRSPSAIGDALRLEVDDGDMGPYFGVLHWPVADDPSGEGGVCTDWSTLCFNRLYWVIVLPINIAFRFTIPDSNYDLFGQDPEGYDPNDKRDDAVKTNRWCTYWLEFLMCIVWIAFLSHLLVFSASKFGCLVGIPPEVMGLTILAAGTSVPDAITSVLFSRKGAYNLAIANSIGSNVFDILLGLGFPWMLAGIKNQTPVDVEISELVYSVSFLFGVLFLMLLLFTLNRFALTKLTGAILCLFYVGYVAIELMKVYFPEIIDTRIDLSALLG